MTFDEHVPPAAERTSESLWRPERVDNVPVVVTCSRCGKPLTVPLGLTPPQGVPLAHDHCPGEERCERRYETRLQMVDVTERYAAKVVELLTGYGEVAWDDEVVAGFTVTTASTTLQGAIEAASPKLSELWQRLFEKAPLADA